MVYTIICHDGRKTLRVPADQWPAHKAHYDYRGPCRARGQAVPKRLPQPKDTKVAYGARARRSDWSEAEYERHVEAQAQLARETEAAAVTPSAPDE